MSLSRRNPALIGLLLALAISRGRGQQPTLDALPAAPDSPTPVAIAQAWTLMQAGQFHEAEGILRAVLQTDPKSRDAHARLAYCLLRENQPGPALAEYTRAAQIHPPDSEELTQVGEAYVLLGDDTDADHWTVRAVRLNPQDAEAWYSLGRIRYTEQSFGDAITCFEHVLSLHPNNVKAENNLGLAEEGMNHNDAAVAAYRQAIAWEQPPSAPGDEQPYLNLAIILLHGEHWEEAEPLLNRAVALSPGDPRIYEQFGHLRLQQGNARAAADALSHATHLDPNNSGLHFLLGQAYRRLGDKQRAEAEFAEAARLAPGAKKP